VADKKRKPLGDPGARQIGRSVPQIHPDQPVHRVVVVGALLAPNVVAGFFLHQECGGFSAEFIVPL
jgi:hypothetical protein